MPTDTSNEAVEFAITVCKNGNWSDTADILRALLDERNMSERQSLAMRDSADRTTAEVMRLEAREPQWRELVHLQDEPPTPNRQKRVSELFDKLMWEPDAD